MENENTRIIEVGGVKMQIDLRNAKVIDQYKVGDNVKVLVKEYGDSYKSYIGTIIGFDDFEKTPTIVIAYLKTSYSTATIEFLYFNDKQNDAEITTLNDWDVPVTKSEVIRKFNEEITVKQREVKEIENKAEIFEKLFGKFFESKSTASTDKPF